MFIGLFGFCFSMKLLFDIASSDFKYNELSVETKMYYNICIENANIDSVMVIDVDNRLILYRKCDDLYKTFKRIKYDKSINKM